MPETIETRATVLADSLSPAGHRLTTLEVTLHRFVLAEFNTHRAFSRNAGSSRATPVPVLIERVRDHPAIPLSWTGEQRGMQGSDTLSDAQVRLARALWLTARDHAVAHADTLHELGIHKSIVNRLLEPFAYVTLVVTATDWNNFYAQRCHPDAQPELRLAAEKMRQAHYSSTPLAVDYNDWHLPYIDDATREECDDHPGRLRAISVARCARVSARTFDGHTSTAADLDLYTRLVTAKPPHASPLEHVATPCASECRGNLTGWQQLRHKVLDNQA